MNQDAFPVDGGALFGTIGELSSDEAKEQVRCHVCGAWLRYLHTHLRLKHQLSVETYRQLAGLAPDTPLYFQGPQASMLPVQSDEPLLVSIPGAAELLGVDVNAIKSLIRKGELQPFYLGGSLRLRVTDLNRLRALRQFEQEEPPPLIASPSPEELAEEITFQSSSTLNDGCNLAALPVSARD